MKQKRLLLCLAIVLVIGMGTIVFAMNYNAIGTEEKKSKKIVESDLPVTSGNLMQTSSFLGHGYSLNGQLGFFLYYEDTGFDVVLWDNKYGCLRTRDEETPFARRWQYPTGEKSEVLWVPTDLSPIPEEEYEKALEEEKISLGMDHYLYVMLKQENHITGLMVMKFPVDNETYKEIELLAAIQFEKQNGEYQEVTEEYIQNRVEEIIKADSE